MTAAIAALVWGAASLTAIALLGRYVNRNRTEDTVTTLAAISTPITAASFDIPQVRDDRLSTIARRAREAAVAHNVNVLRTQPIESWITSTVEVPAA